MLLNKFMTFHTHLKNTGFLSSLLKKTINQFFSPVCLLCGFTLPQDLSFFCHPCLQDLPILPQACFKCAKFLSAFMNPPADLICGVCLKHPPIFNATYALFPYTPPISGLITQLKFHQQLINAAALGELLAQKIKTAWYAHKSLPELIIPVPLHYTRLRERGFNQALEIAKPIAKILGIPIDPFGLQRIKPTTVQSHLAAKARAQNVAQAFVLKQDYANRFVCLVDDVITTGHTISECAIALKQGGAKTIDVWCCARRG